MDDSDIDLPSVIASRYQRVGPLGRGGMGSVWKVWDTHLGRHVALKVVRADRARPADLARFEEEARVIAMLQHPGIVPIHDLGVLPDGRLWFTMQKVRGETLEKRLQEAHRIWRIGQEGALGDGSLRRLLEAFLRVCETVAYAHVQGIVHRDLKPANVMLGRFGEVFVLDWGLAKIGVDRVVNDTVERLVAPGPGTRSGAITGTPAYLSPEQAQGRSLEVTPRSDVYALGATLYDLLCERPPRLARTMDLLITQIASGSPIRAPSEISRVLPVDEIMDRICLTALATDPADRYADASALAAEIAAWLDGARNRERAEALIDEADRRIAESRSEAEAAVWAAAEAKTWMDEIGPAATPEEKSPAWACEDRAQKHSAASRSARTHAIQGLRAALSLVPDLPPAHARLADLFAEQHRLLEAKRRHEDALAVAAEIRTHDREGRHAAYLSGIGALTLHTDVPAEVRLHRLIERGRRLVPELVESLGVTPLEQIPLAMGSWLLTLHREGHEVVRYPVAIGRGEHWHGIPPGDKDPHVVWIPPLGAIGEGERYVPAGWFWSGSDAYEHALPLRRMWADAFSIDRFPVTVAQYVAFLDALAREDGDLALSAQPLLGDADEPLFARDTDGRFLGIREDRQGVGWDLLPRDRDLPVPSLDWHQACHYADWRAKISGLPWRLPMEREWQKAARGADQRRYPWGDHFERSWCRMVMSAPETMIVPVTHYPTDESIYGVRGLAGNIADWSADDASELPEQRASDRVLVRSGQGPQRIVVGGTCGSGPLTCETSQRSRFSPRARAIRIGFRLIRTIA